MVDKRYALELVQKRDVFRRASRTRKSLFTTMITTMGLRENDHSRSVVDKSLDLDALFR